MHMVMMRPATDIFVESLHPAAKLEHELGAYLHPLQSPHPEPEVIITEAMLSSFSEDKGRVSLTPVAPLAVEVFADVPRTGNAFRYAIRMPRFGVCPHVRKAETPWRLPQSSSSL